MDTLLHVAVLIVKSIVVIVGGLYLLLGAAWSVCILFAAVLLAIWAVLWPFSIPGQIRNRAEVKRRKQWNHDAEKKYLSLLEHELLRTRFREAIEQCHS
jgi:hypothetical protein